MERKARVYRIPDEDRQHMCQWRAMGYRLKDIARAYDVSFSSVCQIVSSVKLPHYTTRTTKGAPVNATDKYCRKCGSWLPATEFFWHRRGNGTFHAPCKACKSERVGINSRDEPCHCEGCNNPRHIWTTGHPATYCDYHLHRHHKSCKVCGQYMANTIEHFPPARNKHGLSTTCHDCQPKITTEAQRGKGFHSEPTTAREKILLCIVDREHDEMLFIEGVVTLRTHTHTDQLKHFEMYLQSQADKGYTIIER